MVIGARPGIADEDGRDQFNGGSFRGRNPVAEDLFVGLYAPSSQVRTDDRTAGYFNLRTCIPRDDSGGMVSRQQRS